MRSEQEVNEAIERNADTVKRICMIYLKNHAETEDIFQTVFLKYTLCSVVFTSSEHEKAWFIRVTVNACKDLLKSFFRRRTVALEEISQLPAEEQTDHSEVLEAVLSLPSKYKEVVYLHYYEEYTAPQIAHILGKNVNTVYTLLTRSKQMLREKLGVKNMTDEFKEIFDRVRAEEGLKTKTKVFLSKKTHGYTRSPSRKYFVSAAAACVLFILFGGYGLCFTTTTRISIDINPSIELGVNRFDRVISVAGFNDDLNRCRLGRIPVCQDPFGYRIVYFGARKHLLLLCTFVRSRRRSRAWPFVWEIQRLFRAAVP